MCVCVHVVYVGGEGLELYEIGTALSLMGVRSIVPRQLYPLWSSCGWSISRLHSAGEGLPYRMLHMLQVW